MTVVCDITACPFNQNNFCRDRVVAINSNGQCKHILKRDWNSPIGEEFKEPLNMITLAKKDGD